MRRKGLLVATISAGIFLAAGAARADEKGKMLFDQSCATCHGVDATGVKGLGKDLTTSELVAKKSDAELVQFVNEGRAADHPDNTTGILMPPKAGNPALTDDDIKAIVSYMRTLQKTKGGP